MNYKEILIFDISSEYGHFRKFNTTTSPLTYSIPTRTAVVGIIGAILGLEREISEGKFKEGTEPIQGQAKQPARNTKQPPYRFYYNNKSNE